MKLVWKWFNDMKLRNKIVLAYVLFFLMPIMIIGFFVVEEYRQSALDKATEQTVNTLERVKQRTGDVLSVAIDMSNRLSVDSDLEDIATTRYARTSDIVDAYRDYTTFRTYLDFNPEISRIKLYTNNPTLLNNWEFFPLDRTVEDSDWYRSAIDHAGQIGWFYYPSVTRTQRDMLSLVRSIYFQSSRSFGLLAIDINTNLLNAMLGQEDSETVLADENGYIFASNRPDMLGKRLADTHLGEELAELEPGTYERKIDGQQSKILIDVFQPQISYNRLKVVSVFSIESIVKEANRISATGFGIIAVTTMIALLLIYLICTVLTKRLLHFNRQISRVSIGNFNTVLTVDGNDEIGQISRQFNQMVASIRDLMEEVNRSHEQTSELERKQSEIKLKMLASQINPHFLFNALESVRMKAHMKGEKEIAQTVKQLGRLMRKNLEIKGREISLDDELDIIRSYLEIQKFRHDDRLSYEIEVEPGLGGTRIMPLLIQPLVENAVIHGLERRQDGGAVKVRICREQEYLSVTVSDNGVGIPEARLAEIRQSLDDQDADRIGLHNIQQRLLITYGPAAGLYIDSDGRQGTRVLFRIPLEGNADV